MPRPFAVVRNPVLGLPAARRLADLPPCAREALRAVLLDLRADAQGRATVSWRRNKPWMATYWRVIAVYSLHIARALRAGTEPTPTPDADEPTHARLPDGSVVPWDERLRMVDATSICQVR